MIFCLLTILYISYNFLIKEDKMKIKYAISKAEAKRKGYEKHSSGTYLKKSVLDRYYEGGYLDLPNSKYSAEERKNAGEMLAHDYFLAHYNNVKSPVLYVNIIPTTGDNGQDASLFYQERYMEAVKSIPHEFWPHVRKVCVEDKELTGEQNYPKQSLKNKNSIYYQKMLLNLGLDRLLDFYAKKIKKSS